MTNEHSEPGHGDSPAAWTAVAVMLLGFTVATVAFFLEFTYPVELMWLVWVGVGIVVLGLILGWVMARMGYGVKGPKYATKNHS
jgi:protein-S-isoprenylcysteine O-methyltransferase Ste14